MFLQDNSYRTNRGPKQHPRGVWVGLVNRRSGIPRPPNNSLYKLYPLVGVEENEIIPDTVLANQSVTRPRSSVIISRLSFALKVSEALLALCQVRLSEAA